MAAASFVDPVGLKHTDATPVPLPVALTVGGGIKVGLVDALPAGSANIGDVDVLSLPSIPTGSNVIGAVTQSGTWNVTVNTALPTGANNIGDVDVLTYPGPLAAQVPAALTGSGNLKIALVESTATVTVSGTVSVTGVSTLAEQQTQTTALQLIDNLVHTINASFNSAAAVGGQHDDTAITDATENNIAPVRITAKRAFHVNLRTDAGAEIGIVSAPVRVDPTGTTTQPVSGTVAVSGSVTVTATNLDIRDLVFATDKVDASGTVLGAGTANIGDVDVLTLPALVAGSAKIGSVDLDSDATPGSAVPAVAQYIAGTDGTNARGLKTDSGGELQIDVLTLPAITGTVTANAGTNLNTSALALDATLAKLTIAPATPTGGLTIALVGGFTNSSAPSYTNGQANPLSLNTTGDLRVALATVPSHAVTNAGTFAVQVDGSALTALQLIDDIVHSGDATLSKYAVIGAVYDDTSTVAVTENNAISVRMNKKRALGVGPLHLQTADLANINTTYNNTTTNANSEDIDCDGYSNFSFCASITSANTPTDLQFIVQFKDADGVYHALQNSFWGRLKLEDTEVAAQKDYVWSSRDSGGIPSGFKLMRVRIVAVGTTATNTFTVADAKLGLATV